MERLKPSETRINLLDLVNDINESSLNRDLCYCEELRLVNLANFLIDNKPINKSTPIVESILMFLSKSRCSKRHQLDKIWKFVYQLESSPSQNLLMKIDPTYLEDLIRNVLEKNLVDICYDESYIYLLKILIKSTENFQFFSNFMAERILKDNFVNSINQKILSSFLKNIRQKLTKLEFYNLYEKSIRSFVIILVNFQGETSETLEEKLRVLKKDDCMKFYLLVSHYPEIMYLVE